jgi:hypothetical protein
MAPRLVPPEDGCAGCAKKDANESCRKGIQLLHGAVGVRRRRLRLKFGARGGKMTGPSKS